MKLDCFSNIYTGIFNSWAVGKTAWESGAMGIIAFAIIFFFYYYFCQELQTNWLDWLNRVPIIIGARFNVTEPTKEAVMITQAVNFLIRCEVYDGQKHIC